ncbi:YmfQ family protein (plasmid) [Paenibacillus sp. JNUCC32]|uniref:YmfQ family protein n=1 Tax=Paenibacillus sp. JNUCC32 TaxID=2777984 RepID=UPI00178886B6|nr:YmfQ family protein [Paenibacillus sp. JNUCC-32]QOT13742.1 YmfQ family protein [Paenibacillus sp. JNUCC-32]
MNEVAKRMRDYVPKYYTEMPVATNILDREAEEIARLDASIDDVLAQFFIETATWGLTHWERIFGLTTDLTKTYAQRREILLSRLRGVGTVTAELIENVAQAYANGDVDVDINAPAYTVIITFVSSLGVPDQIDALKAAVRDTTPAHLAIEYVFRFYTYAELAAGGRTYGDVVATGKTYGEIYNRGLT